MNLLDPIFLVVPLFYYIIGFLTLRTFAHLCCSFMCALEFNLGILKFYSCKGADSLEFLIIEYIF